MGEKIKDLETEHKKRLRDKEREFERWITTKEESMEIELEKRKDVEETLRQMEADMEEINDQVEAKQAECTRLEELLAEKHILNQQIMKDKKNTERALESKNEELGHMETKLSSKEVNIMKTSK